MTVHTGTFAIEIPLHWTTDQADAVFDFLGQMSTAVWGAYGEKIIETERYHLLAQSMAESIIDEEDDEEEDQIPW
ncbi:MAG: hypothetical protein QNJ97_26835 [Myxococcota bacterium]|nr:hypothetical protein [Myxococcota bacterium]